MIFPTGGTATCMWTPTERDLDLEISQEILLPRGSVLQVVNVQPRNQSDVASIVTADAVLKRALETKSWCIGESTIVQCGPLVDS